MTKCYDLPPVNVKRRVGSAAIVSDPAGRIPPALLPGGPK